MAGIWKEVLPNFMSLKIVHIILLIVANVNCAEIVVERASGTTPDRFTFPTPCQNSIDCSLYGAERVGDENCRCTCTPENTTFSLIDSQCVSHVRGCEQFGMTGQENRPFTFTINRDFILHPNLEVEHLAGVVLSECDSPASFQYDEGLWRDIVNPRATLLTDPSTNKTTLQLVSEKKSEAKSLTGLLCRVVTQCKTKNGMAQEVCIALKIQGFQKVAVEDVELSTLTRKLDKEAIYTIIIAVVVGLVIIAVIIALASWLCFLRKKSEHSGIKIKRIDRNGQTLNSSKHPARSVKRDENFSSANGVQRDNHTKPAQNGNARKPMFVKHQQKSAQKSAQNGSTKYPHVTPGSSSNCQRHRSQLSDGAKGMDDSAVETPRSQNSAVFVVNEVPRQMNRPLPTKVLRPVIQQRKTKLSIHPSDRHKVRKVVKAAQSALNEFEGARRVSVSQQHQLFKPHVQKLTNVHSSLQGVALHESQPEQKKRKNNSFFGSKSKALLKEMNESNMSLDLEHFEVDHEGTIVQAETGNRQRNRESPDKAKVEADSLVQNSICLKVDEMEAEVEPKKIQTQSDNIGVGDPEQRIKFQDLIICTDPETEPKVPQEPDQIHITSDSEVTEDLVCPSVDVPTVGTEMEENDLPMTSIDDLPMTNIDDLGFYDDDVELPPPTSELLLHESMSKIGDKRDSSSWFGSAECIDTPL